jgi:hypothetical protein
MKNFLLLVIFLLSGKLISQTDKDFGDKFNYVIGLPKATTVELELIKNNLVAFPQITYSEFFFKDHVLLIEVNSRYPQALSYQEVETILFQYFGHDYVQRKYIVSFEDLKAQRSKTDKFTIK